MTPESRNSSLLDNGTVNRFPRKRTCTQPYQNLFRSNRSLTTTIGVFLERCSAKPVLTEGLCVVQKQEYFNNILRICEMYTWRKAKHIHNRQTQLLVREDVTYGLISQGFSWGKKPLVVRLKGLAAKTNWLAVNRQSYSNFDFDLINDTSVEAGSNTSTVTLRVVGGDENGSLKLETVKDGH
jgi:hypothetical protein